MLAISLMLKMVIIFKLINSSLNSPLINKLIVLNISLAIWTMLPIPPLDGSRVFYGSRMLFAFSFISIISAAALLYFIENVWLAIAGALLIGIIGWLLYYIFLESKLWQGPAPKMK